MKPKLRFKGFDEVWEKAPFKKMVTRYSSMGYDESVPSVEYEDINSREGTLNKDIKKKTTHKSGQFFDSGDLLFGKLRPYLGNILLADFKGIAVGDFWVFKNGLTSTNFLYPFLYSSEFSRVSNISSGSKMPRSDWELVSNWIFHYPLQTQEQSAIGSYFKELDEQITATEAKIERLRKVKAASLQAMFPQEGETKPRLRFKGFDDEWEYRKIGDVLLESNERGCQGLPLSVSISKGVYPTVDFIKTHTVTDFSNYKLVNITDIVYNSMRMWQGASGVSHWKGYVSPAYTVLKPNQEIKICPVFFSILFKLQWIIKLFAKNSQGLTKDTWNLKYPAISIIDIPVPPQFEEQQLIADYFANLDRQITLEEQRLEKLRQIKAACLDNMFV